MNNYSLVILRNLIPIVTFWLILIIGSLYIFSRGRNVYQLVKGSLIGRITKVLVYTILIETYIFGIITTIFLYVNEKSIYLILPTFFIWFMAFISSLKVIMLAEKETKKIVK